MSKFIVFDAICCVICLLLLSVNFFQWTSAKFTLIVLLLFAPIAFEIVLSLFMLLSSFVYKKSVRLSLRFHQMLLFIKNPLFLAGFFKEVEGDPWVKFNNCVALKHIKKHKPSNILVLVPYCIQKDGCAVNVVEDIENCTECGMCNIQEIKRLKRRFNIRVKVSPRSLDAFSEIKRIEPDLVIGVACRSRIFKAIKNTKADLYYIKETTSGNEECRDRKFESNEIINLLEEIYL